MESLPIPPGFVKLRDPNHNDEAFLVRASDISMIVPGRSYEGKVGTRVTVMMGMKELTYWLDVDPVWVSTAVSAALLSGRSKSC